MKNSGWFGGGIQEIVMGRKINAFHIEDQFLYDYDFMRITSLNAATAVGLRIASTRNAFIRREYGGEVSELTDAASPFCIGMEEEA